MIRYSTLAALLCVQFLLGSSAMAQDCVIVLHGLFRTEFSMKAVEWALEDAGFRVVNVTYPSVTRPIQELAVTAVEDGLAGCREHHAGRINFVTHSLGGILVRQYLSANTIRELHRVVMLGPPNQGAQVADYVVSLAFTAPLRPEAIDQLATGEQSVPLSLGAVDFELGVIAGTNNRIPLSPGTPQAASDGTVAVEETKVEGMRDFIELPVSHTFMMWRHEVLAQVVHFLQTGRFRHDAVSA